MTIKYNKTIKTGGACGSSEMFGVCDMSQKPAKHFKLEGPCDPAPKICCPAGEQVKKGDGEAGIAESAEARGGTFCWAFLNATRIVPWP